MAFIQVQDHDWHEGEETMHRLMRNPHLDNPTFPSLSPQLANHLRLAPLVAIGILDKYSSPWTTLWGGEHGIGAAVAQGIIGIRTTVTPSFDPVVEDLFGNVEDKVVIRPEGKGRMVSGVTIDLETRKRVKLFGRMVAGGVSHAVDELTDSTQSTVEAQLVLRIEQSLGNCPKYLNKKRIIKAAASPRLLSDRPQLNVEAIKLLDKADLFFVSSSQNDQDMDTNHRGGPPGFVRIVSNETSGAVLCWPEYSGNRLYQTLGNLKINPEAGICVPDFDTGDMLYMTGTTEVLIGSSAAELLPRSNLAVKFTIKAARMVAQALPYRGVSGDRSPYNPGVRFLAGERKQTQTLGSSSTATLIKQTKITPTISRYRFSLDQPAKYTTSQYVTLDLNSLLNIGYSHMRDDDPGSLNDDFVRTFTVSSSPEAGLQSNEFEITIRRIGAVTEYMSRFEGSSSSNRAPLEVEVKGFGGEFDVTQTDSSDRVAFIAAGIGITPLLPAVHKLDLERLRLFWSLRAADLALALDTFDRHPGLARITKLFITGVIEPVENELSRVKRSEAQVLFRRMLQDDLDVAPEERIYICAAPSYRKLATEWLPGRQLIFEDFSF